MPEETPTGSPKRGRTRRPAAVSAHVEEAPAVGDAMIELPELPEDEGAVSGAAADSPILSGLAAIAASGDAPSSGEDAPIDELDDATLDQLEGMHEEDDRAPPADAAPSPEQEEEVPGTAETALGAAEAEPLLTGLQEERKTLAAPRRSASGWFGIDADAVIRGWCLDRSQPEQRMTVALAIDGAVVGEALADRVQPQLRDDGHGDGRFAFAFAVPPEYHDGEPHEVAATIVTPGYDGTRLKIKNPAFTLPFEAPGPLVALRQASSEGIEGVLTGSHLREELDVWMAGTRLGEEDVSIEWGWSDREALPFRVRFPNHALVRLLADDVRLSYPGIGEALGGGAAPADLLAVEVNPLGGSDYEVVIGPGVLFADDTPVEAHILMDEPDGSLLGRRELFLENNAAVFTLDDAESRDRMRLALAVDGEPLGTTVGFAYASLSRRMLPGGNLELWSEAGPDGFGVPEGAVVERGFYAFPAAIKNQYVLSGALAAATLTGTSEQVLLARSLPRTSGLGKEPVQVGIGFFARASRPVAFTLCFVDDDGGRHTLYAGSIGSRWKSEWRTVDFHRPDGDPSPLRFEVAARALADGDDEPTFLEIAGLHCGEPDLGTFADAVEVPLRREFFGAGENLVVNANLLSWPAGLAFSERRSRFELADGWNLFNRRSSAEIAVAAVPGPSGKPGRYALSVSIPQVPDYCRLEVALDCQDLGGRGELRFDARCDDLPTAEGTTYSPDRWSFIDRIYLLKRDTREEGERLVTRDTVVANVARRVVVTRQWEESRFAFTVTPAGDAEFDLARDDGDLVEYLAVLEFRRPIALTIHGLDVHFGGAAAEPDSAPLLMEDRNIRAQVGVVRGIDEWNARAIVRPAVYPVAAEAAATPERWSWKHMVLGTVDVGICVYNAADETLDCLRSLVGASGVPHTVRIINDGSHEDTRQRIAAFVADKPWMRLIDNDGNRGYTYSANRAVLESDADWVILLNSDTIVSKGWIEGLLEAAASDPGTAFVGAVSNAATYQSVPELYDGAGKWAVNQLPKGHAPAGMAAFVAAHSGRHFPVVPLLNGFCTLIKRSIFAEVGGLNEQAFPAGYGEENDLCLRVRKAGYTLRVADHVYVYHSKSASFGTARRTELAKAGDKALRAIHQDVDLGALGRDFLETPALVELRETVRAAYAPTELASAGQEGAR